MYRVLYLNTVPLVSLFQSRTQTQAPDSVIVRLTSVKWLEKGEGDTRADNRPKSKREKKIIVYVRCVCMLDMGIC